MMTPEVREEGDEVGEVAEGGIARRFGCRPWLWCGSSVSRAAGGGASRLESTWRRGRGQGRGERRLSPAQPRPQHRAFCEPLGPVRPVTHTQLTHPPFEPAPQHAGPHRAPLVFHRLALHGYLGSRLGRNLAQGSLQEVPVSVPPFPLLVPLAPSAPLPPSLLGTPGFSTRSCSTEPPSASHAWHDLSQLSSSHHDRLHPRPPAAHALAVTFSSSLRPITSPQPPSSPRARTDSCTLPAGPSPRSTSPTAHGPTSASPRPRAGPRPTCATATRPSSTP